MNGKYLVSRALVVVIVLSAITLTEVGALLTAIASALVAELVVKMVVQDI